MTIEHFEHLLKHAPGHIQQAWAQLHAGPRCLFDALSSEWCGVDIETKIDLLRALERSAMTIDQFARMLGMPITYADDGRVSGGGGIITVAGLDSNIRGQQHTRMDGSIIRPSLVIPDDPQTRQSANSPAQTRHRLSILNGDVLGLGGPGVKMAGSAPPTSKSTSWPASPPTRCSRPSPPSGNRRKPASSTHKGMDYPNLRCTTRTSCRRG